MMSEITQYHQLTKQKNSIFLHKIYIFEKRVNKMIKKSYTVNN